MVLHVLSDLFEDSISDVDIFDQCGILQQILVMPCFLTKGSLYNIFYLQSKEQYLFHLSWEKGCIYKRRSDAY